MQAVLLTKLTIGLSVAVAHCALAERAHAEWTFLGPTPYRSAVDSPFPVDGSNPNFYLDDFEDGLLNTPGVFQPLAPITHAAVIRPDEMTDSVDSDDGAIDGNGQGGRSIASSQYIVFPMNPPFSWSFMRFGFDGVDLGFYPNSFGFVWTDGPASSNILIELFDAEWQLLTVHEFQGLGDDRLTGETAEDRFLGVSSSTPFAFAQITAKYPGTPYPFEIDHLQYGVIQVPEPSAIGLAVTAIPVFVLACYVAGRRRQGPR